MDNLASHRHSDFVNAFDNSKIRIVYHVGGTTHWSQVADGQPFALLAKNAARRLDQAVEVDVMSGDVSSKTATVRALQAVFETEGRSFKSDVIRKAARDRGVWPFDAERIRELARLNHGKLIANDVQKPGY